MTATEATSPPASSRLAWRWAAATALVVALVVAGAYAGRRYVARVQLAAARVPAPAAPAARVAAVLRPEAGAVFVVPLSSAAVPGRLVLLAGPRERTCPPRGACAPAPQLDTLLALDAASGRTLASAPLQGAARDALALAVGPSGLADVVSADAVDVYNVGPGAGDVIAHPPGTRVGGFALPAGVACGPDSGAALTDDGTLALTARLGGRPMLVGLDALSGAVRFMTPLPGGVGVDGPVYDASDGLLLALGYGPTGDVALAAYGVADGAARGTLALPAGTRLGPLDGAGTLYVFAADGRTLTVPRATLAALDAGGQTGPAPDPSLYGATALGWNASLGHVYVADARGLRIVDARVGATLAALPLPVAQPPDAPLAVDEAAGLVAVPTDHGAVAVVRDAADPAAGALTPDTAALLARAAVARLVPQPAQDPPFVAPGTFTVGPGRRDAALWADDPTLGWQDAGPGMASLAVAPAPGGAYDVTFALTWTLRFVHANTWTERVTPDGAVQLLGQQGDALP